jgi:hypothetical protein
MQSGYEYTLTAGYGQITDPTFQPELSPREMLKMGVFEGKYLTDCQYEFPKEWYKDGKMTTDGRPHVELNFFNIKSRQPLQEWRRKKWIIGPDIRGWFQWYCRYYIGRRLPDIDRIQIARWRAFARHRAQIIKNCKPKDIECRPRQRQALLQWAYNPLI